MKTQKILFISIITILILSINANAATPAINNSLLEKNESGLQSYKFIVLGDTRQSGDDNSGLEAVSSLVEDIMATNDIKFILHSGDLVDYGGEQSDYDTYYWPEMEDIASTVPIYYAVGNHEYSMTGTSGSDLDLVTYRSNVDLPGNEVYYSFNTPQNDTHVIVLNSDYYFYDDNVTRQQQQQTWLENDLGNNSIDRIIVMFHRPLWGVNPARVSTEYEPLRAVWHDYLIENGVDMVINGHDHHFYHTIRNDTHYVVTGGGTAAMYQPIIDHPDIQKTWKENDTAFVGNHVVLVEASEDGYDADVIMANGTTSYEFNVDAKFSDTVSPTISSPADISIEAGATGKTLSWIANDQFPGNYSIKKDDEVVKTGSWENGVEITYSLDDLAVGNYNFKIQVTDAYSNTINDTVLVEVLPKEESSSSSKSSSTPQSTPGFTATALFLIGLTSFLARKKIKK